MSTQNLSKELLQFGSNAEMEMSTEKEETKKIPKYALVFWADTNEFNVMPKNKIPRSLLEDGAVGTLKAARQTWRVKIVKTGDDKEALLELQNELIDEMFSANDENSEKEQNRGNLEAGTESGATKPKPATASKEGEKQAKKNPAKENAAKKNAAKENAGNKSSKKKDLEKAKTAAASVLSEQFFNVANRAQEFENEEQNREKQHATQVRNQQIYPSTSQQNNQSSNQHNFPTTNQQIKQPSNQHHFPTTNQQINKPTNQHNFSTTSQQNNQPSNQHDFPTTNQQSNQPSNQHNLRTTNQQINKPTNQHNSATTNQQSNQPSNQHNFPTTSQQSNQPSNQQNTEQNYPTQHQHNYVHQRSIQKHNAFNVVDPRNELFSLPGASEIDLDEITFTELVPKMHPLRPLPVHPNENQPVLPPQWNPLPTTNSNSHLSEALTCSMGLQTTSVPVPEVTDMYSREDDFGATSPAESNIDMCSNCYTMKRRLETMQDENEELKRKLSRSHPPEPPTAVLQFYKQNLQYYCGRELEVEQMEFADRTMADHDGSSSPITNQVVAKRNHFAAKKGFQELYNGAGVHVSCVEYHNILQKCGYNPSKVIIGLMSYFFTDEILSTHAPFDSSKSKEKSKCLDKRIILAIEAYANKLISLWKEEKHLPLSAAVDIRKTMRNCVQSAQRRQKATLKS